MNKRIFNSSHISYKFIVINLSESVLINTECKSDSPLSFCLSGRDFLWRHTGLPQKSLCGSRQVVIPLQLFSKWWEFLGDISRHGVSEVLTEKKLNVVTSSALSREGRFFFLSPEEVG